MPSLLDLERKLKLSPRFQRALQHIYGWYIGLVLRTTRWSYVGFEQAEQDITNNIARIYCCWHGRLALIPYFRTWNDHPISAFVSDHVDAQIATRFMRKNNVNVIPVNTSGEKSGSVRAAVKALRAGGSLAITPDGPFGPGRVVQPGAITIAALAQVRLSACAYSTRWRLTMKSWDRFVLPLPFGRGVFVLIDGFIPPGRSGKSGITQAQTTLAKLIDQATAKADELVARPR